MKDRDLHPIKQSILKELGYRNSEIFSELQKGESSSKVSFHLKKLRDQGLIRKKGDRYETTSLGKEYLAYLESKKEDQSIILNHLLIYSNGKIYLGRRSDPLDPFEGVYRGIVEREEKETSMEEIAREKFNERFDEDIKGLRIAGVLENRFESDKGFSQNYISFFTQIKADIQEEENIYPIEDVDGMETLPGYPEIIRKVRNWEEEKIIGEWKIKESEEGELKLERLSF